ncbi:RlpA-like double-psi beta-barrel domain-containing protein [Microbispora rosea]|uniref:RlpA-like double-psi beta-barrel domain-containing protein n=1 Tax=Microbispora rosea TaxID=58117 RepID=UPI000ADA4A47|nr:RlpA-like double-psi beta-barrel domain-containing protein [Microbispora rosea]
MLITYGGKSIQVPIRDLCPGCAANRLDLSRPAFAQFANPDAVPRLTAVSWQFTSV